jgi:hypothetical protein
MKKIPTLFARDPKDMSRVLADVTPEAQWVLAGEGIPTRKRDGTNIRVTVAGGKVVMVEKRRNPSREERAAGAEPGYVQAEPADPADRHIFAAVEGTRLDWCPDGAWSCEALGPKIQGGVEGVPPSLYMFVQRPDRLADCTRTFDGIREFLTANVMEGIVWHHPDGRLAKIKRRDFGLRWPAPTPSA